MSSDSIKEHEVNHFNALSEEWWNPKGKFRPLHMMNPIRLDYINTQISLEFDRNLQKPFPYKGLDLLDVGCGGGLITEAMARLGATVKGIDIAHKSIEIAKTHAQAMGLDINYEHTSIEKLSQTQGKYHIILCMEVLEHVNEPKDFLTFCRSMLHPNGILIASTINRNLKSFFLAILGAEYLLHWVPVGTHDWNSFIKPEEMKNIMGQAGLTWVDTKGFIFHPLLSEWKLSHRDFDVNYVSTCIHNGD
ncbi:MAG: bifunctional 2-polyprenyl-6-hydroxyphenol methylase/3-demethylubiquinol 3-O-methyltransferase UbiG [Rhodobacteraceae bacterium]|nr:bifunctional 2-polyprenyl-6-hydroxyphenol methylase/3-demethylubiquinol 3-O-methyltransferase UbiG [Paracoccaceae bacterium]